jgi:hypothetical protein
MVSQVAVEEYDVAMEDVDRAVGALCVVLGLGAVERL